MPRVVHEHVDVTHLGVGALGELLDLAPLADVRGESAARAEPVCARRPSAVASQASSLRLAITTSAPRARERQHHLAPDAHGCRRSRAPPCRSSRSSFSIWLTHASVGRAEYHREEARCRSGSSDGAGWSSRPRASAAWACRSSTAPATRRSRSRRSTARSSSASHFLDTADVYGPYTNEELRRQRDQGTPRPGRARDQVRHRARPDEPMARGISGKPEYVRACLRRRACSRLGIDHDRPLLPAPRRSRRRRSRRRSAPWPSS